MDSTIKTSFYLGGHPTIKKLLSPCLIMNSPNAFYLGGIDHKTRETVKASGSISKNEIRNIKLMDVSDLRFRSEPKFWERTLWYLKKLDFSHIPSIAFIVIHFEREGIKNKILLGVIGDKPMLKALAIRNQLYGWIKNNPQALVREHENTNFRVEEEVAMQIL